MIKHNVVVLCTQKIFLTFLNINKNKSCLVDSTSNKKINIIQLLFIIDNKLLIIID